MHIEDAQVTSKILLEPDLMMITFRKESEEIFRNYYIRVSVEASRAWSVGLVYTTDLDDDVTSVEVGLIPVEEVIPPRPQPAPPAPVDEPADPLA